MWALEIKNNSNLTVDQKSDALRHHFVISDTVKYFEHFHLKTKY